MRDVHSARTTACSLGLSLSYERLPARTPATSRCEMAPDASISRPMRAQCATCCGALRPCTRPTSSADAYSSSSMLAGEVVAMQ